MSITLLTKYCSERARTRDAIRIGGGHLGQLQNSLSNLLGSVGVVSQKTIAFPRIIEIRESGRETEIANIYQSLGGVLDRFELNLRSWDMEFNGAAVELDEHLHFNRYRLKTLLSPAYSELPGFPLTEYKDYCERYEDKCLGAGSYGGKWSNPSTVKQFGAPGPHKDLSRQGAPRWRQRAFYDFVKDLAPQLLGIRLVRIAIWDTIVEEGKTRTILDVLKSPSSQSAANLAALIGHRDV